MAVDQQTPPRTAVISGAASGMGREFAMRMHRQGWRVLALDRDEAGLQALAADCEGMLTLCCDMSDLAEVQQAINTGLSSLSLSHFDRVVSCAAIMPTGLLRDQAADVVAEVMAVNYGGTVNLVTSCLPAMLKADSGEVVIFSSSGAVVPIPECGAYCASKAATQSYAEILGEELRGSGVHLLSVCPALVDTPLLDQAVASSNPKMIEYSISNRRFASPAQIIDVVEKGLAKKRKQLLPGEAGVLAFIRRLSPRLLWALLRSQAAR